MKYNRRRRGSIFVLALFVVLVVGTSVMFSMRGARNDYFATVRRWNHVQARYLAEGALERAKGDVLAYYCSTEIGGPGIDFANYSTRYGKMDEFLSATRVSSSDDLSDGLDSDDALWEFVDDDHQVVNGSNAAENLDINEWGSEVGGVEQGPVGSVRTYVTQARFDDTDQEFRGQVCAYDVTITGQANVGGIEYTASRSYHHQIGAPTLSRFLLLGVNLSDCSMCHLQLYGDIGQTNPDNQMKLDWAWKPSGSFGPTQIRGDIYLAGNFDRTANLNSSLSDRSMENLVVNPGGIQGAGTSPDTKPHYIYCKNADANTNAWKTQAFVNGAASSNNNPDYSPFVSNADPSAGILPTSADLNIKDEILPWFEPRAESAKSTGDSRLRVKARDNNIRKDYRATATGPIVKTWGKPSGTTKADYQASAIDRVADKTVALVKGQGLHPYDDLDLDGIINRYDADIDQDGVPETDQSPTNPQRTLNDKLPDVYSRVKDSDSDAFASNDNDAGSATTTYYWRGEVSGVANSMDDLLKNNFATNTGTPGDIKGVYPSATLTGAGNPDYTANGGKRNLMVIGSKKNPIESTGQTVVRGDVMITGWLTNGNNNMGYPVYGSIVTHNNIFVPNDLRYIKEPDWTALDQWDPDAGAADNADQLAQGDRVALIAGANVVVGNYMHVGSAGNTGIMHFLWGNMVDINAFSQTYYKNNDNRTGAAGDIIKQTMHDPLYVMDGAEGGFWENGVWRRENEGNTVAEQFMVNGYKYAGGLDTAANTYNPNRKHQAFSQATNDSLYKGFYISTPGILPIGSTRLTALPASTAWNYGTFTGGWYNSDDLKFFTQEPLNASGVWVTNSTSGITNGLGAKEKPDYMKKVQAILYADYGVMGGAMVETNTQYLQFYGSVIGREIQLLSVMRNQSGTAKYTNQVGALYYDKRLRMEGNPLGFPTEPGFYGGEMAVVGVPPMVNGNRDDYEPFTITPRYAEYVTDEEFTQ